MRFPDVLGVLGALVVGAVLLVLLLFGALGQQPGLPTLPPPSIPVLPTLAQVSPSAPVEPSGAPLASETPEIGLAVGDKAPDLEVTLLDGSTMNTADFIGTPIWINFMATWCPQCQDELPMMQRYAKLLGGDMNILVVDVGEDRQSVRQFMRALNIDLTVAADETGTAQRQWGAFALPVHYWLDEQGIVREIVYGGAPPEIFIEAITAVVPDFSAEIPTPRPSIPFSLPPEPTPEASPAS